MRSAFICPAIIYQPVTKNLYTYPDTADGWKKKGEEKRGKRQLEDTLIFLQNILKKYAVTKCLRN